MQQGLAQREAEQLKRKKADVKTQTTKVQKLRVQAGQVALAQFQNRHLDAAAKLLLSDDTDDFLSQISTVEKVSENQNSALQDYQEEQAKLTELERSTETEAAQLKREAGRAGQAPDLLRQQDRRVQGGAGQAHRGRAAAHRRRGAEGPRRGSGRRRGHHHPGHDDLDHHDRHRRGRF